VERLSSFRLVQLLAAHDLMQPLPALAFLATHPLEDARNALLPEDLFARNRPRMQVRFAKAPR